MISWHRRRRHGLVNCQCGGVEDSPAASNVLSRGPSTRSLGQQVSWWHHPPGEGNGARLSVIRVGGDAHRRRVPRSNGGHKGHVIYIRGRGDALPWPGMSKTTASSASHFRFFFALMAASSRRGGRETVTFPSPNRDARMHDGETSNKAEERKRRI